MADISVILVTVNNMADISIVLAMVNNMADITRFFCGQFAKIPTHFFNITLFNAQIYNVNHYNYPEGFPRDQIPIFYTQYYCGNSQPADILPGTKVCGLTTFHCISK